MSTSSEQFLCKVSILDTTDAASVITGSFTTSGGIGVGKSLYVGSYFTQATSSIADATTAASGTNPTALYYHTINAPTLTASNTGVVRTTASTLYIPGAPIAGTNTTITNAYALQIGSGNVYIGTTTDSTSITSGSLQLAGGIGIAKSLYVGGVLNVNSPSLVYLASNVASSSIASPAFKFQLGSTSNILLYNSGTVNSSMDSSSGNLSLGGNANTLIASTADSSSATTGALQVAGGVSVTKSIFVAGSLQANVYDPGAANGWYTIGLFTAPGAGYRLKLDIIGCAGYDLNNNYGGETIVYATIDNNRYTTAANINGIFYTLGDNPAITAIKFLEVNRYSYYVIAYCNSYTRHSYFTYTTQGATFTQMFSSTTDPGSNSGTVQVARFGNLPQPQSITLTSPLTAYNAGYAPPVYYRDMNNNVYIEGLVQGSTTNGQTIFILPAGYRPAYEIIFLCAADGGSAVTHIRVDVRADGTVVLSTPGPNIVTNSWISLNGISFVARQ